MYRNSASFGKRYEYVVIAELLKREFDIYTPLVDDMGIDCVIRKENKYLEIQIKARSGDVKNPKYFANMKISPRDNYFFIFYTESDNNFWVIPSKILIKKGHINKTGKHKGKVSVYLSEEKFKNFINNFDLLKDA